MAYTSQECPAHASEIDDDRRSRYYESLKSSMTAEQKAAFEKLLSAEHEYIKAHAAEVDQGGIIRGIRTIGSQSILEVLFHTNVVHFERKKLPVLSDNQVKMADSLLNREYEMKVQQLGTRTKNGIEEGAVTAKNLSGVEETRNTYPDAWVAFARLRYPGSVAANRARITLDRYRLLKTI